MISYDLNCNVKLSIKNTTTKNDVLGVFLQLLHRFSSFSSIIAIRLIGRNPCAFYGAVKRRDRGVRIERPNRLLQLSRALQDVYCSEEPGTLTQVGYVFWEIRPFYTNFVQCGGSRISCLLVNLALAFISAHCFSRCTVILFYERPRRLMSLLSRSNIYIPSTILKCLQNVERPPR